MAARPFSGPRTFREKSRALMNHFASVHHKTEGKDSNASGKDERVLHRYSGVLGADCQKTYKRSYVFV